MVREPVLDTVVGVEKTEEEVEEVLEVVTETRLVEVGQGGQDLGTNKCRVRISIVLASC